VGNTNNAPMQGTTGITGAAPIWHAFMNHQLQNVPDDWPGPPGDVKKASMGGRTGWFLDGTGPGTTDGLSQQGCRTWSFGGGTYFWCGGGDSNLPGDPAAGGGGAPAPAPLPPPGHHHGHG
jgi:membrane peptidoglycan carboxypeptidase